VFWSLLLRECLGTTVDLVGTQPIQRGRYIDTCSQSVRPCFPVSGGHPSNDESSRRARPAASCPAAGGELGRQEESQALRPAEVYGSTAEAKHSESFASAVVARGVSFVSTVVALG
jgi:hypothetical protein